MVAGMDGVQHQLRLLFAGLALAVASCGGESPPERAEAAVHADSALPRDVGLGRFRAGLSAPVAFTGGTASRDALVRRFVDALERRDRAALATLLLTKSEFAYLYYPSNPEAQPPYHLAPGLMWFLLEGHSNRGLTRLHEERSGRPLGFTGYSCPTGAMRQGENRVWAACSVRHGNPRDGTVEEWLFGPIVERGGRYKFASYTNKL